MIHSTKPFTFFCANKGVKIAKISPLKLLKILDPNLADPIASPLPPAQNLRVLQILGRKKSDSVPPWIQRVPRIQWNIRLLSLTTSFASIS